MLPHEGHGPLVLRQHRAERVDHGGPALERGRERDAQRRVEGVGVGNLLVVPDAAALAPPVGLVVAQEHRERPPEEERAAFVPAEVVGRAEDDLPVALFEPAAVEADHREVFGELGGVDEADGARHLRRALLDAARGEGLDHLAEAVAELAVGIDRPRARALRGHGEGAQNHRLGLAGGRVAVDLGHGDAPIGDEEIGAGDAVPQRRRREPHRLLPGRQAEERVEQRRAQSHQVAELVVDRGHVFGGAVEGALRGGGDHQGLFAEAGLAVGPGVGDDAGRDDAAGEGVVAAGSVVSHHASSAMANAVAR